jgi:hypothetical protein
VRLGAGSQRGQTVSLETLTDQRSGELSNVDKAGQPALFLIIRREDPMYRQANTLQHDDDGEGEDRIRSGARCPSAEATASNKY